MTKTQKFYDLHRRKRHVHFVRLSPIPSLDPSTTACGMVGTRPANSLTNFVQPNGTPFVATTNATVCSCYFCQKALGR